MRNMKTKFLSLVMALAMVLSLAACGGDTTSDTSGNADAAAWPVAPGFSAAAPRRALP